MSLRKWADITTWDDLVPYVQAETAEAQAKCSAAYPAYKAALDAAVAGQASWADDEMQVAAIKAQVEQARVLWRNANCSGTGTVAAPPLTVTAQKTDGSADDAASWWPEWGGSAQAGIAGGSNWMVLLGVGVGLYFLFFDKKGKRGGKKTSRRRR